MENKALKTLREVLFYLENCVSEGDDSVALAKELKELIDKDVEPHIVIIGNVIDGCAFAGPFDDYDTAFAWAEGLPPVDDWHVAILDKPDDGPVRKAGIEKEMHIGDICSPCAKGQHDDCEDLDNNEPCNCNCEQAEPPPTCVEEIPENFPVKPISATDEAIDRATCGHCGLSWDDAVVTSMTPAPSARCPFEAFHHYTV